MTDQPASDAASEAARARNRFFVIQMVRVSGVAMVLAGLMIAGGKIAASQVIAYVLIGVGLVDVFAAPLLLARAWRTRP